MQSFKSSAAGLFIGIAAIGVAVAGIATNAAALPILLTSGQFAAEITTPIVEDFEGFTIGAQSSPMTLANATFSSSAPAVFNNFLLPTQVLVNNSSDPATGRIFSALTPGTTLFGLDIGPLNSADVLTLTAVGVSGTSVFQQTLGSFNGFVGILDPLGLISVTFLNIGTATSQSAYAFDNVTTNRGVVPEPTTLAIFAFGLAGLGFLTRRRRREAVAA